MYSEQKIVTQHSFLVYTTTTTGSTGTTSAGTKADNWVYSPVSTMHYYFTLYYQFNSLSTNSTNSISHTIIGCTTVHSLISEPFSIEFMTNDDATVYMSLSTTVVIVSASLSSWTHHPPHYKGNRITK